MKNNIKVITVLALLSIFSVGCALTEKLPSVTVGGKANKDAVLNAKLSKKGASLTLPLIDVDVPLPSIKTGKDVE